MQLHVRFRQALTDQSFRRYHRTDLVAALCHRLGQRHEMAGRAGVLWVGADEQVFHARRSS
jgi:hypothetical protein